MTGPIRSWKLLLGIWAVVFVGSVHFAAAKAKDWVTLENCELLPNRSNDGDSFYVRANEDEYLVRLYFVDAPETGGVGSPARLVEQARYFDITVPQVIEIGRNAKSFVEAKLAKPFIVVTRMAEGLGHSDVTRILGFVKTKDGADLGEQLVANGLARIHGTKTALPDGASAQDENQKLEQLQAKAKQAKLGGWNITSASSASITISAGPAEPTVRPIPAITRAAAEPVTTPTLGTPPSGKPIFANAGRQSAQSGKLDVNTASKKELQKIPGIGETLADRIIAARPFTSADDLQNVKGVGKGKRYEQLRPFFR